MRVSVAVALLSVIGLTTGCAGPPPDGFFTDFFDDVHFFFAWDGGETTPLTVGDSAILVSQADDGTYWLDPGTLELTFCAPLRLEEDGPPTDGVVRLRLAEPASCSWQTEAGSTIDVAFEDASARWAERSLSYELRGTATWGSRSGTVRVSFAGTRM